MTCVILAVTSIVASCVATGAAVYSMWLSRKAKKLTQRGLDLVINAVQTETREQ